LGNSINKDKVSQISLIILSIFAIFVFEPFKNLIQNYIDKQFFRTKYNYKEVLNKFLGKVKDMPSNQELIALLVQSINQSIPVTAFAIIWRDHDLQLIKSEQINFEPEELNEIDMLIRNTGGQSFYSAINSTEEELDLPEISDELTNNGIKIIINSYQSPSQSGLTLLLGAKKSESRYSFEDLELLRTLLNSTGVALQKLLLQSELILKEAEAQKLKEISELKSYFVSSVSHELKTPLTAIKLYAEFLNSNENLSEEKKKKYLAVIEGECNRLDRLINNVLGFSKIERGAKTYKFQNLDLRKIIDYIIDTFQYQLKMQNFELIFNADTEGVYPIYGDEDSLKEVFINLISNSIKYSLNEKLMILNLRNESDFIFFSIEDKGIGIRQDEIENIFAPFYRSKEMNVSNLGGAGLGLAIVKTILDAHSATVEIESQLNKGTIFIIKFPKDYENQNINS
jgi:signal transduction histidine kinase